MYVHVLKMLNMYTINKNLIQKLLQTTHTKYDFHVLKSSKNVSFGIGK